MDLVAVKLDPSEAEHYGLPERAVAGGMSAVLCVSADVGKVDPGGPEEVRVGRGYVPEFRGDQGLDPRPQRRPGDVIGSRVVVVVVRHKLVVVEGFR